MLKLSEIIKYHRKASGLNQKELADLAGVGKTVIFDIEKGKETIRFSTLVKVLNILNIKLEFISPLMNEYFKEKDEQDN